MDVLRSCYTSTVRFFHDSENENKVVWYFVPDDRKVVPFAHMFGSRIYERDDFDQPPIGERYTPVPWRGGEEPANVAVVGLCGEKEKWQNGASILDPLPETWPGTNVPKCCGQPPPSPAGGLAIGGRSSTDVERPGGLAIGGKVVEGYFASGGLAVGGLDLGPTSIVDEGGLAIGGTSISFPYIDQGGLAEGGTHALGLSIPGGLAVGGLDVGPTSIVDEGGLAVGGTDEVQAPIVDEGGLALGGTHAPGGYVSIPFAPWLLSTELKLSINNLACGCMPTELHFVWNSSSAWDCTSSATDCSGNSFSDWSIVVNAGGTGFDLSNPVETLPSGAITGPPFLTSFIHIDGAQPAYCGGLLGYWDSTLTEE